MNPRKLMSRVRIRMERSSPVLRWRYPLPPESFELDGRLILFLGGLHKSGTSMLHDLLRAHPRISGMRRTVHREDEGQFMQGVYRTDAHYGGPGRFAFVQPPDDGTDVLSTRRRLLNDWSRYFADRDAPMFVEKSPANLIRMGWLQNVFPEARFIVLVRHPIVVASATQRWSGTSLPELLTHWWYAHVRMLEELKSVERAIVVRYEDLVSCPEVVLDELSRFAGLDEPLRVGLRSDRNPRYLDALSNLPAGERKHLLDLAERLFGRGSMFGYLGAEPWALPDPWVGSVVAGTLSTTGLTSGVSSEALGAQVAVKP